MDTKAKKRPGRKCGTDMSEQTEANLSLFRELVSCAHNVYFWTYDPQMKNIYTNCPAGDVLNRVFLINEPETRLLPLAGNRRPVVMMDTVGLTWIADFECDASGALLWVHVIGPVFIEDISAAALTKALREYGLSLEVLQNTLDTFLSLPVIPHTRFSEYGIMLHYCISGSKITISDLQYATAPGSQAGPQQQTPMDAHASWAMEQKLLQLVEEGNPDYKKIAAKLATGSNVASLGNGNSMRHLRNITIIFTTLCTRAAIRGGLEPETAFTLSDKYIRGAEACTTLGEVAELSDTMQEDFVNRVYQCRLSRRSPAVQRCCSYIQTHLDEKMSVPHLAAMMGYSENYLSKKFKKETGRSLAEYMMSERIRAAQIQLISTQEDIQTIALHLGFTSQSYFGEIFRRYAGMTPGEYRNHRADEKGLLNKTRTD